MAWKPSEVRTSKTCDSCVSVREKSDGTEQVWDKGSNWGTQPGLCVLFLCITLAFPLRTRRAPFNTFPWASAKEGQGTLVGARASFQEEGEGKARGQHTFFWLFPQIPRGLNLSNPY